MGVARRALEESIAYAKERKTFGQPIGRHQAIGFMLSDMASKVQAARLLCYESAWRTDCELAGQLCRSFQVCTIAHDSGCQTQLSSAVGAG